MSMAAPRRAGRRVRPRRRNPRSSNRRASTTGASEAGGRRFAVALIVAVLSVAGAHATAAMPAIVVEADSGVVLYAERALEPWRPASLTKLMTLYLVFEALDAGTLDPEDPLIVSAHAASRSEEHTS